MIDLQVGGLANYVGIFLSIGFWDFVADHESVAYVHKCGSKCLSM